jgi:hypothetical protein
MTKGSETNLYNVRSANGILLGSICALIISQSLLFLGLQFPILYSLWVKPHFFSLIFLPIIFLYLNQIKNINFDIYNNQTLLPSESVLSQAQASFLETFFLQLLNPIVLPNPIFFRLNNILLFRYSTISSFFFGNFLGIITGYGTFLLSTLVLLKKLEEDAPTIYRLLKIKIHQFFFIFFFVLSCVCLSRTPLLAIGKTKLLPLSQHLSGNSQIWPNYFFNYDIWNRPLRLLEAQKTNFHQNENIKPFNKMFFSQYFFESLVKEGKPKLYHNFPESLSKVFHFIDSELENTEVKENNDKFLHEWSNEKKNRQNQIYQTSNKKIFSLEKGFLLEEIIQKKLSSLNNNGILLSKYFDPRLSSNISEIKSFLFLTDPNFLKNSSLFLLEKDNKLNLFFEKNQKHGSKSQFNELSSTKNLNIAEFSSERDSTEKKFLQKLIKSLQQQVNFSTQEDLSQTNLHKLMPVWNPNINREILKKLNQLSSYVVKEPFGRLDFPGTQRARRRKALSWDIFQNRVHAPFFLNDTTSIKNFFFVTKKKFYQINQNVTIGKWQWKGKIFQFLRGALLSIQAYIRKYIKLPLLIIVKNLSRQLLFYPSEWEKDWNDFSQEIYVDCDFNGNEVSIGVRFPNFFHNQGPKQIKILQPFQLRFWTRSNIKTESIEDSDKYSYLNLFGQETKIPFGKVKKSPSFWQLTLERIKLLLRYKVLKNFSKSSKKTINQELIEKKPVINESTVSSPIIETQQKFKKDRNLTTTSNLTIDTSRFKEKSKVNRKYKYTFQNSFIIFQKELFQFYKFYLEKKRKFFFKIGKDANSLKRLFIKIFIKLIFIINKISLTFSSLLRFLSYSFFDFFNVFFNHKNKETGSKNINELYSKKKLSQAYIIHNIWQSKIMNRPNLTSLMESWDKESPLKKNLEVYLIEQGILKLKQPEDLTKNHWKEWLRDFQGYTPSLKVWNKIYPDYWTHEVEEYWKKLPAPQLEELLEKQSLQNEKILDNKFLQYHLPLFSGAKKTNKLWKFNLLFHNYTNLFTDGDVDSFYIWKTKELEKKMNIFLNKFVEITTKHTKKTLLANQTNLDFPSQNQKNLSRINILQQENIKQNPLFQIEKRRFESDAQIETIQQRVNFYPIAENRLKNKKIKNKLRNLTRSVLKRPQIRKSLSFNERNSKMLLNLFKSENMLFTNILENWHVKILDDELLMYNIISSLFNFANKNKIGSFNFLNNSSFFPTKKSQIFENNLILPEDIFLPNQLLELRILNYLDLNDKKTKIEKSSSKNSISINESKNKQKLFYQDKLKQLLKFFKDNEIFIKQKQVVTRFLWPTHRIEDLACMNRFCLGTVNQSRFSMLRIQNFVKD